MAEIFLLTCLFFMPYQVVGNSFLKSFNNVHEYAITYLHIIYSLQGFVINNGKHGCSTHLHQFL